jgi:hypothetical protein
MSAVRVRGATSAETAKKIAALASGFAFQENVIAVITNVGFSEYNQQTADMGIGAHQGGSDEPSSLSPAFR